MSQLCLSYVSFLNYNAGPRTLGGDSVHENQDQRSGDEGGTACLSILRAEESFQA